MNQPAMSVVLTVISLGTRVVLAYLMSAVPSIGVTGIWAAVPIGWILADLTGLFYMKHTPVYNFINNRLADESAVLKPL